MNLLNIKISLLFQLVLTSSAEELGTTTSTSDTNLDKNLQEITFDLGYGPESFSTEHHIILSWRTRSGKGHGF